MKENELKTYISNNIKKDGSIFSFDIIKSNEKEIIQLYIKKLEKEFNQSLNIKNNNVFNTSYNIVFNNNNIIICRNDISYNKNNNKNNNENNNEKINKNVSEDNIDIIIAIISHLDNSKKSPEKYKNLLKLFLMIIFIYCDDNERKQIIQGNFTGDHNNKAIIYKIYPNILNKKIEIKYSSDHFFELFGFNTFQEVSPIFLIKCMKIFEKQFKKQIIVNYKNNNYINYNKIINNTSNTRKIKIQRSLYERYKQYKYGTSTENLIKDQMVSLKKKKNKETEKKEKEGKKIYEKILENVLNKLIKIIEHIMFDSRTNYVNPTFKRIRTRRRNKTKRTKYLSEDLEEILAKIKNSLKEIITKRNKSEKIGKRKYIYYSIEDKFTIFENYIYKINSKIKETFSKPGQKLKVKETQKIYRLIKKMTKILSTTINGRSEDQYYNEKITKPYRNIMQVVDKKNKTNNNELEQVQNILFYFLNDYFNDSFLEMMKDTDTRNTYFR